MGNTIIRERNPETGEIVERQVNVVVVQPRINPENPQPAAVPPEDRQAQLAHRIRPRDGGDSCCDKILCCTFTGAFFITYLFALSTELVDYTDPNFGFGKIKPTLYPTRQPTSTPTNIAPIQDIPAHQKLEYIIDETHSGNLRQRSYVQQISNGTGSLAI